MLGMLGMLGMLVDLQALGVGGRSQGTGAEKKIKSKNKTLRDDA